MLKENKLLLNCLTTSQDETVLGIRREILQGGHLNWDYLLKEANYHRLISLLYYNLKGFFGFVPDEIKSELEKKYYAVTFSNQKLSLELRRLLDVFNNAGIDSIVLKGALLDEVVYPQKGLRPFGDLDVFIRKKDLLRVKNILSQEGYTIPPGILPEKFYREFHFELPFVNEKKGGIYVEIHWDLLPRWRPHSERIFETWNSRRVFNERTDFYSLGPEELIIYFCAHLDLHAYMNRYHFSSPDVNYYVFSRSSGNKLIWFSDLSQTINFFKEAVDWTNLIEKAQKWGVITALYTNLSVLEKLIPLDYEFTGKVKGWFLLKQGRSIKKNFLLMTQKTQPLKQKGIFARKLGFRQAFSLTDLVEYIFPDKEAFTAKYNHPRSLLCMLKYRLKCSCEGLKAIFIIIFRIG